MKEVYEQLKQHLASLTEEEKRKEFEKFKEYNNIGPLAKEF